MSTPQRILALSPAPSGAAAPGGAFSSHSFARVSISRWDRVRPDRRKSWESIPADQRTATYRERGLITLGSIPALLSTLELNCLEDETTWIVCRYGGHDLALSGVLALIDNGSLRLKARPPRSCEIEDSDYFATQAGTLCVMADPPIILDLMLRGRYPIMVVSLLNYLNRYTARTDSTGKTDISRSAVVENQVSRSIADSESDARDLAQTFAKLVEATQRLGASEFGVTAGACAKRLWRDTYKGQKPQAHQVVPIRKLERAGFRAGEVRPFRVGWIDERVHLLDVNSLYPSIMADKLLPCQLIEWCEQPRWHGRMTPEHAGCSIAEVVIDTDKIDYPIRLGKKLAFAMGTYRTVLCGPELREAVELGAVRRIGRYGTYAMGNLFDRYVNTLYRARLDARANADADADQAAKMLLNSLFGKFGQRLAPLQVAPNKFARDTFGSVVICDRARSKSWREYYVGGQVLREGEAKELPLAIPAISAFVTAWGRWIMRGLREVAGVANVYYQGVDSLLVNDAGLAALTSAGTVHETELGKLRLKESAASVEIIGANAYEINGRRVIQGLNQSLNETTPGVWDVAQLPRLSTIVQRGDAQTVDVRKVPFRLPNYVHTGRVWQDGWLMPVEIGEACPSVGDPIAESDSFEISLSSERHGDRLDIDRFFASRSFDSDNRYAEYIRQRKATLGIYDADESGDNAF